MNLYHYFEKEKGPFVNLSELPLDEAQKIQDNLQNEDKVFAAKRNPQYLSRRRYLEQLTRKMFIEKGGLPVRQTPYYMVVEECPWLNTWYKAADHIRIPIGEFDLKTISFTYGDTFPTFSPKVMDHLEFRKTVYTYDEILKVINKYGLPQNDWKEPIFAQPAYVEVQIWSDWPVEQYRSQE